LKVFRFHSLEHQTHTQQSPNPSCVVAIGNFDGVHLGHFALISKARELALTRGLKTSVLTFEPHPREYFAKLNPALTAPARICTLRDKLLALKAAGVDQVYIARFNQAFASLSAQAFIDSVLLYTIGAKVVVVGDDFRFGAKRAGDFASLQLASIKQDFDVQKINTFVTDSLDGTRVSSSAIRQALKLGQFQQANALLGRRFQISGHVIHGKKLGRTLGFPTLNIPIGRFIPALQGIFVVKVHGLSAQPMAAVASLGTRPAVETNGRFLLEVHLLDWSGDAYGKSLSVEFLLKLRDEANYDTLAALTDQITRDTSQAKDYFIQHPIL
jgi:riboflavin kinase / FMN adenylyltransferase